MHAFMKTYIIVGGGLAGSMLAARLVAAGQRVLMWDEPASNAASRVAAGMFNVITGKFFKKTWMADELLAALKAFFRQPELAPLAKHLHFAPIYRPFREVGEYNRWLGESAAPGLAGLVRFQAEPILPTQLHNPHGGIWIEGCGWLNIPDFIEDLKQLLKQNALFELYPHRLDCKQIDLNNRCVLDKGKQIDFDEAVLCSGVGILDNGLWDIPITPSKGEVLGVFQQGKNLDFLLSGSVYVVPHGGGNFTVGATHEWEFSDGQPSEKGLNELRASLHELLDWEVEVRTQRAGIRPSTHDRRPVLGTHPQHPNLHVFTGFGAKGVLLAPYFSALLCDYLTGRLDQLPPDCEVRRFYKKRLIPTYQSG